MMQPMNWFQSQHPNQEHQIQFSTHLLVDLVLRCPSLDARLEIDVVCRESGQKNAVVRLSPSYRDKSEIFKD